MAAGPLSAEALGAVDAWPGEAAVAVVVGGSVVERAGPADRPRRWASVSKVLTALAAWVAVEEGTLDLAAPAGPPGATVRHLLAHASGLAFDDDTVLARPGERRIYSNRGIEIVAGVLAASAGMPFDDYLREGVTGPLGMTETHLDGSPAAGVVGPLDDLARLAAELQRPTLVDDSTLASSTAVAFPGLAGVLPGFGRQDLNDWGLGVEVSGRKWPHWTPPSASPRTFGHFGQSGSFLWVDPDAGVACVSLSDRDFGEWAKVAWPETGERVLRRHGRR